LPLPCGLAHLETGIVLVHEAIFPENGWDEKDVNQLSACNVGGDWAENSTCDNKSAAHSEYRLDDAADPYALLAIFRVADYSVSRYVGRTRERFATVKGRNEQN
jgi:hypothetical protein